MASRTVPPDASRRSDRSRRAIYAAALSLTGEVGYRRTTVEAIAARAGVGKQTIYRWWSSKGEVLLEAFLDLGEQAEEAAGAPPGVQHFDGLPNSGDLEADLKFVLRATVDELLDPAYDLPARALAAEGVVDRTLGHEVVRRLLEPSLQLYVQRLEAAQEAGQVRDGIDPRIALELFVSPIAQRWLQRTAPLSHDYADSLVEYALYGLAPH